MSLPLNSYEWNIFQHSLLDVFNFPLLFFFFLLLPVFVFFSFILCFIFGVCLVFMIYWAVLQTCCVMLCFFYLFWGVYSTRKHIKIIYFKNTKITFFFKVVTLCQSSFGIQCWFQVLYLVQITFLLCWGKSLTPLHLPWFLLVFY